LLSDEETVAYVALIIITHTATAQKRRETDKRETTEWYIVDCLFLLHIVQTGSEVHLASYPMATGGSFRGVKRQGREADHTPPSIAEVKNGEATFTLTYVFMARCLSN
jgi:hypothetical protein